MFKTPLSGSRWATSSTPVTLESTFQKFAKNSAPQTHDVDVKRLHRLIDRLQWKTAHLQISAEQAELSPYNGSVSTERMFKIDFFEYYGLLERILVTLLVILGVVPHNLGDLTADNVASGGIIGRESKNDPFRMRLQLERLYASSHRFHASLLDEFRHVGNPLHHILGMEVVQGRLHRAKDLRNRWKDAENHADGQDNRGADVSLDRQEVDAMLRSILADLREAAVFATQNAKDRGETGSRLAGLRQGEDVEMDDIVPFDAMMEIYD